MKYKHNVYITNSIKKRPNLLAAPKDQTHMRDIMRLILYS